MPATRPRRTYGIVATSLAAHVALLAVVAVQTPHLRGPPPASGPPEPVIPVLIMPRVPPPASDPGGEPTPIRLHRRPQRFNLDDLPLAPLLTPEAETPTSPQPEERTRTLPLPRPEDAVAERARAALRSRRGCDDPALTRTEREACMERFAAGGRDAPFLGLGVDRDKARELEAAVRRREQDYNYKRDIRPLAPPTPGADWDKYRGPPGQAESLAGSLGNDRPTATVPLP
jgi:hypothetical protein